MPYTSIQEAEKSNSGLSKYSEKAKRGWLSAFNTCMADGGDESKCFAIAYSVANKVDGKKSAAFESGPFPEITDAEWKALQKSHHEKYMIFERKKEEERKRIRMEFEEENRAWKERERKMRERIRREMRLSGELISIAKEIL